MAKKSTSKKTPKRTLKKNAVFSTKHFTLYMLVFALIGAFTLWVSFAAPHKPSGGGTVSVVLLESTDNLAHFGKKVTFNVTTSNPYPWVNLVCTKNGTVVMNMTHGFFPAYQYGQTFTLGPTDLWPGGTADCTARLVSYDSHNRQTLLGTTTFHVYD
jgi:hypothetical protein